MERAAATDTELIEASRRGDQAAFGTIIERYQRAVHAVAYSGTRDQILSEDIAQDTFVTAWHRLGSLRDADRLPAWLCGIARNLARSARRRSGREVPSDDVQIVGRETAFDAISERQADEAVASALRDVPDTYREPLVLFYYEQQSVKDVARALGITVAATQQRLSRGRQCLADVGGLVEQTLERRQPRRGLAAAVLTALAVATRSSHVEASTTGKASSMLKMGVVVVLVSATAGTGYLVERSSASPISKASTAKAKPTATPSPSKARAPAMPALPSGGRAVPPKPSARGEGSGGSGSVALDCATTARHLAELMLTDNPDKPGLDERVRTFMLPTLVKKLSNDCTAEGWSAELMACITTQRDEVNAHMRCDQHRSRHEGTAEKLDGEFSVETVTLPPAPAGDKSCAAVAKHMTALGQPDPAAIAKLPEPKRSVMTQVATHAKNVMLPRFQTACERGAWNDEARSCILASTHSDAAQHCLAPG